MRILVITYEFPPVGGGGGAAARDISLELVKRNHDVHVLTSHYKGLPRQEILQGIHIHRVPAIRRLLYKADLLTMACFVFSGIFEGIRSLRLWRPEIIHVHFAVPSGPVGWILSRLSKTPYVLTSHLGDVPGGVPEKTKHWFRWIYPFTPPIWRDAAHVVAVSQHTRQLAMQQYSVNVQVISNGADLTDLNPGEIKLNNPPRIIFVGRFMEQKNPLQVVRTLAELKRLTWECTMVGDGPLRPEVEQEIQRLGLEDRIHLPGWISPEAATDKIARSDILFMPSSSEGLSVVGVQSLALGLSIIASNVPGMLDLVEPDVNGYLVESQEQMQGFVTALEALLSFPTQLFNFRQASRQKAELFDIKMITSAYEEIFTHVVNQAKQ